MSEDVRHAGELVMVMQAKPAGGRLTWLVEACVRELCGSNHATPLKLEVGCLNGITACLALQGYLKAHSCRIFSTLIAEWAWAYNGP